MANGDYFDGDLFLSNEGMTYLLNNRLTKRPDGGYKILVSAFGDDKVMQRTEPVYLTIFIENNHNGRFDITEYEYIVLKFASA